MSIVGTVIHVDEDISTFDADGFKGRLATSLSVEKSTITQSVRAASVVIMASIAITDANTAASVSAILTSFANRTSLASAAFGVPVIAMAEPTSTRMFVTAPPPYATPLPPQVPPRALDPAPPPSLLALQLDPPSMPGLNGQSGSEALTGGGGSDSVGLAFVVVIAILSVIVLALFIAWAIRRDRNVEKAANPSEPTLVNDVEIETLSLESTTTSYGTGGDRVSPAHRGRRHTAPTNEGGLNYTSVIDGQTTVMDQDVVELDDVDLSSKNLGESWRALGTTKVEQPTIVGGGGHAVDPSFDVEVAQVGGTPLATPIPHRESDGERLTVRIAKDTASGTYGIGFGQTKLGFAIVTRVVSEENAAVLEVDDRIVRVNGDGPLDYDGVVAALQKESSPVELTIVRGEPPEAKRTQGEGSDISVRSPVNLSPFGDVGKLISDNLAFPDLCGVTGRRGHDADQARVQRDLARTIQFDDDADAEPAGLDALCGGTRRRGHEAEQARAQKELARAIRVADSPEGRHSPSHSTPTADTTEPHPSGTLVLISGIGAPHGPELNGKTATVLAFQAPTPGAKARYRVRLPSGKQVYLKSNHVSWVNHGLAVENQRTVGLQGKVEEPNTSPLTTRGLTPISEPVAAAHTIADRVQRAKSANRMNNGVEAAPTGIGDVKTKALDV